VKIFLVGYMGSGKSTLGKKISLKAKIPFYDLDQEVEKASGLTVTAFFEKFGETRFREEETKILKELIDRENDLVMATGGGTPCFHGNMELMNKYGVTIYLELPLPMLVQRLEKNTEKRPLLKGKDMNAFIEEHIKQRYDYYEKAKITVDARWIKQENIKSLLELVKSA
jgi:shikimate kinase